MGLVRGQTAKAVSLPEPLFDCAKATRKVAVPELWLALKLREQPLRGYPVERAAEV